MLLKSPISLFLLKRRRKDTTVALVIGLVTLFFSLFAHSATESQLTTIQQAAENYLRQTLSPPEGGRLEVKAAALDSRISASDCPIALSASSNSANSSASNITVLVECPPDNWKIYVPVRVTLTVPMVTAAVPLHRGQLITAGEIALR